MKVSSFFFTLLLIVMFSACKKKTDTAPAKNNLPFIYGRLTAKTTVYLDKPGHIYEKYGVGSAVFYDDSIHGNTVNGGKIIINDNDTALTFPYDQGMPPIYLDFSGGVRWKVVGSGYVPAIDHSSTIGFPTYSALTPDSIILLNGLTFDVGPVATNSADSVFIRLYGRYHMLTNASAGEQSITLTAAVLNEFIGQSSEFNGVSRLIPLTISTSKYEYQVIEGKKYQFVYIYELKTDIFAR